MKYFSLLIISFFVFKFSLAQQIQLSPNSEISVLTFGSGSSLNDAFGHSAFRVRDNTLGFDIVYGYGAYDFDTPNFYLKFAQGKLKYAMSRNRFSDIFNIYSSRNRTIEEQVLNLNQTQKQQLFNYLQNNFKPENREYLYDFFYDNCATRIRDVFEKSNINIIAFQIPDSLPKKTFRQLIHDNVGLNTWGSFGIDIALGSVIDKEATPNEFMFLPEYIHLFLESAKIDTKPLVKSQSTLFRQKDKNNSQNFLLSPLFILGLIGLLIVYITYSDYKKQKRSRWLDVSLFVITGLIGIIILLLWFATDHTATAQNYNLLWAFPLNLLVVGQLLKQQPKSWVTKYLKFLIIMLCLMTLHWLIGIQVFTIGLIPFLIALFIRYVFLVRHFNRIKA